MPDVELFHAAGDIGDGVMNWGSVFDAVGNSYMLAHTNAGSSGIRSIENVRISRVEYPTKKIVINEPTLYIDRDPKIHDESKWYSDQHAGVAGFVDGHAVYVIRPAKDHDSDPADEEIDDREFY